MKYKYSCFRLEKHINHNRFSGLLNAVEIFLFNFLSFHTKQEAQLMLTTGSTRLAVSRGQQTWYHFGSIATFR